MATHVAFRSPRGCLTCKQRRKKCDETRPTCQRCRTGNFRCLGYDHLDAPSRSTAPPKSIPEKPLFSYEPIRTLSVVHESGERSSLRTGPPHLPERSRHERDGLGDIPRMLELDPAQVTNAVQLVVSQLSRLGGYRLFIPQHVELQQIITRRVNRCQMTRWCMFLGAQITQMILDGKGRRNYLEFIRRLHRHTIGLPNSPLDSELCTRLGVSLELSAYAFMVSNSPTGYSLFKSCTPLFLRFASKVPQLWSGNSVISIFNALRAPRHELTKFVFWDVICSLILGVPPILQYDTTFCSASMEKPVLEWVYGCPEDIVHIIASINASRYENGPMGLRTGSGSHEWREAEMRLRRWAPRLEYLETEGSQLVARLAVQESWRHAVLVYMYMCMCGADSSDPRVENAVRQVVQLCNTVESESSAAVASRQEPHREILRERIHTSKDMRYWVLRGADFVPVLDHLWHGAARGGRPVRWEDYIRSRRKKCDRSRPACARCIKAGFECLGYDHLADKAGSTWRSEEISSSVRPLLPAPLELENGSSGVLFGEINKPTNLDLTCGLRLPDPLGDDTDLTLDNYDPNVLTNAVVPSALSYQPLWSTDNPMIGTPTCPSPSLTWTQSDSHSSSDYDRNPPRPEPRAARTLSPLAPDVNYIINLSVFQHARVLDTVYFRPGETQLNFVQNIYINRLQSSSIARCITYIDCRVIKWFMDGTSQDDRSTLIKLLDKFEQKLQQVSAQPTSNANEVASRRNSFLDSSILRIRLGTGQTAHKLLQAMAPTFLQIVAADSALWPSRDGPPSPSLARIFASIHYELAHFVHMDLICAMAYGLPQVVQYDTSIPAFHSGAQPVEWLYCFPPEFQICLADINMRCANGYISHDWHLIEQRLMAYTPDLSDTSEPDSWRVVARLGIIESWRQALLIYLYMAVCGLASDDARVQAAVRQIIQLSGTVKRQNPLKVDVQPVIHHLLAGICARSEKQRAYNRERLLDVLHSKLWLLPGSEFVPVLDHLWHGAGADGRPIRWSDYILSRHKALPISLA